jgi:hypothetical protein
MSKTEQYFVQNSLDPDEEFIAPEEPFIQRTVGQMLFGGYYIPFMRTLEELKGEPLLPNNTFGLYYGVGYTFKIQI